jgi:hypothetical protein
MDREALHFRLFLKIDFPRPKQSSPKTSHSSTLFSSLVPVQVQPSDANRPRFVAVTSLEDVQAVRCAEFHPNGSVYAIGSNSKTFRICEYPQLSEIRLVCAPLGAR